MAIVPNIVETLPGAEYFNRLSRERARYRQTDDGRTDDDIVNVNASSRSQEFEVHVR